MGSFEIVCQFDESGILKKSETEDENSPRRMYGWASTASKDADSERILQEGLDLSEVVKHGWVNWNHQAEKVIGIPRVAELRHRRENGKDFGKCVYTEFDLLKNRPLAQEVWDLAKSLEGTDRTLGLSLEGIGLLRKGSNVLKARVLNIAVATNPKNTETSVRALVKALAANDAQALKTFAPLPLEEGELTARVEGIVSAAMTKALAITDTCTPSSEIDKAIPDLIAFPSSERNKLIGLDPELQKIGNALANAASSRGDRLTKAEAALFTFLVSGSSLPECFKVFGVQ